MRSEQPSFTDAEYSNRRRVSRREQFLETMDATIPWASWVELIEPFYYDAKMGRKPKPIETMLRMYLLQVWFSLSDEGVEDAIDTRQAQAIVLDWCYRFYNHDRRHSSASMMSPINFENTALNREAA